MNIYRITLGCYCRGHDGWSVQIEAESVEAAAQAAVDGATTCAECRAVYAWEADAPSGAEPLASRHDAPESSGDPLKIGAMVGRAIAHDVAAEGMPRQWTGLDPQDADQFLAAGISPDTPEWDQAYEAARAAFFAEIA
jgi:hypothetical protein